MQIFTSGNEFGANHSFSNPIKFRPDVEKNSRIKISQFRQEVGVNVRYVAPGAYMQAAQYASRLDFSFGCFIGRNEGKCPLMFNAFSQI
jgi:hypothetical protein